MGIVVRTALVLASVLVISIGIGGCTYLLIRWKRTAPPAGVDDGHRHRWSKWLLVDERQIHVYGEVDEGRDLPDRIDTLLRRQCIRCGLPQTQTIRGLDPKNNA